MKYIVQFRGDPLYEVPDLVSGYIAVRDEFKKRWPKAFYGPQEAAAHGFTVVGKTELTPHEAAALRSGAELPGDRPSDLGDALRTGMFQ